MTTLRMAIVWRVLERAIDCADHLVIAACRRMIDANRAGRHDEQTRADMTLIEEFEP